MPTRRWSTYAFAGGYAVNSAGLERMSDSAFDFKRVVWPAISGWLGGGELIPVESVTDSKFASLLDQRSGIDAWHLSNEHGIRGIASRVQWTTRPFDTFTIRVRVRSGAPTELHKRAAAISSNGGWLYPHLTVQAYVSERRTGRLVSVSAIPTSQLIECAQWVVANPQDDEACRPRYGVRSTSDAQFAFMRWDWIAKWCDDILMWPAQLADAAA